MPIGFVTAPFVGVYGQRPYEAQSKQQKPQESPAMTQVTDEMVAEACFVYQQQRNMRAALEAALAVRNSRRPPDICYKLREQAESTHSSGFITVSISYPICAEAADLIERQAEEIADNEAFVSILQKIVQLLTTERNAQAEEVERLKGFVGALEKQTDILNEAANRLTAERAELLEALQQARSFVELCWNEESGEEAADAKYVLDLVDAAIRLARRGLSAEADSGMRVPS